MNHTLSTQHAIRVFLTLALAYFLSTLMRTITATLSPVLVQAFTLSASDLGLLAGGYFMGFAFTQLPMGRALDQHGPRKVQLLFLTMAVAGCLLFAVAEHFAVLLLARVMVGVGVSACLMAPLTGYRRWLSVGAQLRANSWMLMTGSLGMLASTLPVQWLLPQVGWRPILVGMAGLFVVAMLLIRLQVPEWQAQEPANSSEGVWESYKPVWRNHTFIRLSPVGFFCYGGLLAMQTLWASPWMIHVSSASPQEAAFGLFIINLAMLGTFWSWGWINPWLSKNGFDAQRLLAWGIPLHLLATLQLVISGTDTTVWSWVAFCMSCSVVTVAQPAVGLAFESRLAGRALSAYNLVIFVGVFVIQWGYGLMVDALQTQGFGKVDAYRWALAIFLVACSASYLHFLWYGRDNSAQTNATS